MILYDISISISSGLVRASSHHHQCLIYKIHLFLHLLLPLQLVINLFTNKDACRGKILYIWISLDSAKAGPTLEGVMLLFYHYIIVIRILNGAMVQECSFLLNYTNSV